MPTYDQTARGAARRDGPAFFRWARPRLDPSFGFVGWHDARTTGGAESPELTTDLIGEFVNPQRIEEPWLFVVEFKSEPRGDDLEQLGEYLCRTRRDRRPEFDPRLKYKVGGLLVDLTGHREVATLEMEVPGIPGSGLFLRGIHFPVAREDAAATLTGIARGDLALSVLPWVPLMRGGGEPAVVQEWRRLAHTEPNAERRRDYALDAICFAELPGWVDEWRPLREEFAVKEVQWIKELESEARAEGQARGLAEGQARGLAEGQARGLAEGQARGLLEGRRSDLLLVLQERTGQAVPVDLVQRIQSMTDLSELQHWLRAAIRSATYDEFRAAVRA